MPHAPTRLPWSQALAVAVVVLVAVGLRLVGIDRELPHRVEPDAFLVQRYQSFEQDPANVRLGEFVLRYPTLFPRLLALMPYPEVPARVSGPDSEAEHLAAAGWPYRRARTAIAFVSVAGVLLTWVLARRFLAPSGALLAAAFLATSLLSILFAQQGRPHSPQAVFALAATLLALRVVDRPSRARIALAALGAACAAATLQNGMLAALPVFAAVVLGLREARGGAGWRAYRAPVLTATLACGLAVLTALTFYPGLPYIDADGLHLGPSGGTHSLLFGFMDFLRLPGLAAAAEMLWVHDPVLCILAPFGALIGLVALVRGWRSWERKKRLGLLVVASYCVPYVAVLAPNSLTYERFLLPIYPYIASLAGGGLAWIAIRCAAPLRSPGPRALVLAAIVSIGLGPAAFVAVRYARAAAAPDRLELAAAWIETHVDPVSVIAATPGTVLPLLYDPEYVKKDLEDAGAETLPWFTYQELLSAPDPARRWKVLMFGPTTAFGRYRMDERDVDGWLGASGAEYIVVETTRKMTNFPVARALVLAARQRGELVFQASGETPTGRGRSPGEYQGASAYATWLLRAEQFGPDVEIYRLRR